MTLLDFIGYCLLAVLTIVPVGAVGCLVYLVGARAGYKEGWDTGREDIRGDHAFRREQLDALYRECQRQRDEALADIAAAHAERDGAIDERDELRADFADAEERLAGIIRDGKDERDQLSAENAKLIEENGRLIAASVGGVDAETAHRLVNHIGVAMHWLKEAYGLMPCPMDEDDEPEANTDDDDLDDDTDGTCPECGLEDEDCDCIDPDDDDLDDDLCPVCGDDWMDCECDDEDDMEDDE